MDLFQALGIPQDAAYRASEPRNSNFSSSRTMAAPSSSAPHIFSPSQQPMASQGFSVSQNMPDGLNPLSVMERPPNCGQDESWIPSSGQRPNLSSQTLSHPGSMQHTQDENRMPGIEQGFRCYSQSSQPHDNLGDSVEDLTDDTCSPQIQSMEEYLNENIDTRKPKLVPATVPRSTGEWKTKLQHLCDKHGVRPQFDYKEMSEQRFVATLTVSGRLFQTTAPQLSKKLAQEEACKLAIAETPSLETMDGIEGAGKRGKKRKSEDLSLQGRSEEWVGIINNHSQQNKLPPPTYEDFAVEGAHQRFTSKVTIAERPTEPFTAEGTSYKSKKDARSEAARAAVLWLRSEGLLSYPADKQQRRMSPEGSATIKSEDSPNSKSLAEQVHKLVQELGLKSPKFDLRRSTLRSGQPLEDSSHFYDIHAEFDERDWIIEPSLRGHKGEVKHCLGQKRAKEECCALIVRVLQGVRVKRLASV